MRVGILALQGDFAMHAARLRELGAEVSLVRSAPDLADLDALVLPGGESTAMLKLMGGELRLELSRVIKSGLPTLATCAGIILLAKHVQHPSQESLNLIDIDVTRNAYGRQLNSFVEDLHWTEAGQAELKRCLNGSTPAELELQGVFIRAPRITRVGPGARVLMTRGSDPVLVKEGRVLAAAFHPELSERAEVVHRYLLCQ